MNNNTSGDHNDKLKKEEEDEHQQQQQQSSSLNSVFWSRSLLRKNTNNKSPSKSAGAFTSRKPWVIPDKKVSLSTIVNSSNKNNTTTEDDNKSKLIENSTNISDTKKKIKEKKSTPLFSSFINDYLATPNNNNNNSNNNDVSDSNSNNTNSITKKGYVLEENEPDDSIDNNPLPKLVFVENDKKKVAGSSSLLAENKDVTINSKEKQRSTIKPVISDLSPPKKEKLKDNGSAVNKNSDNNNNNNKLTTKTHIISDDNSNLDCINNNNENIISRQKTEEIVYNFIEDGDENNNNEDQPLKDDIDDIDDILTKPKPKPPPKKTEILTLGGSFDKDEKKSKRTQSTVTATSKSKSSTPKLVKSKTTTLKLPSTTIVDTPKSKKRTSIESSPSTSSIVITSSQEKKIKVNEKRGKKDSSSDNDQFSEVKKKSSRGSGSNITSSSSSQEKKSKTTNKNTVHQKKKLKKEKEEEEDEIDKTEEEDNIDDDDEDEEDEDDSFYKRKANRIIKQLKSNDTKIILNSLSTLSQMVTDNSDDFSLILRSHNLFSELNNCLLNLCDYSLNINQQNNSITTTNTSSSLSPTSSTLLLANENHGFGTPSSSNNTAGGLKRSNTYDSSELFSNSQPTGEDLLSRFLSTSTSTSTNTQFKSSQESRQKSPISDKFVGINSSSMKRNSTSVILSNNNNNNNSTDPVINKKKQIINSNISVNVDHFSMEVIAMVFKQAQVIPENYIIEFFTSPTKLPKSPKSPKSPKKLPELEIHINNLFQTIENDTTRFSVTPQSLSLHCLANLASNFTNQSLRHKFTEFGILSGMVNLLSKYFVYLNPMIDNFTKISPKLIGNIDYAISVIGSCLKENIAHTREKLVTKNTLTLFLTLLRYLNMIIKCNNDRLLGIDIKMIGSNSIVTLFHILIDITHENKHACEMIGSIKSPFKPNNNSTPNNNNSSQSISNIITTPKKSEYTQQQQQQSNTNCTTPQKSNDPVEEFSEYIDNYYSKNKMTPRKIKFIDSVNIQGHFAIKTIMDLLSFEGPEKYDIAQLAVALMANLVQYNPENREIMRSIDGAIEIILNLYIWRNSDRLLTRMTTKSQEKVASAYLVVLIGFLIKDHTDNRNFVLSRLPNNSFDDLIILLQELIVFKANSGMLTNEFYNACNNLISDVFISGGSDKNNQLQSLTSIIVDDNNNNNNNDLTVATSSTTIPNNNNLFNNKPVVSDTDEMINSMGSDWHRKCFTCSICETPLEGYFVKEGKPICKKDYEEKYLEKCTKCSKPISGNKLTDNVGKFYHPECFTCTTCNAAIDQNFFIKDNKIQCPKCNESQKENQKKQSKDLGPCFNCKKPCITNEKIIVVNPEERYHTACFKCVKCRNEIQGEFYTLDNIKTKNYVCMGCS
eukprot:gene981-1247_t